MSICEKTKIELFDSFYDWLKADGLKPRTSERLHRKKIFASLMANSPMTIENFSDFLKAYEIAQIKALGGQTLIYNGNPCFIKDIEFLNAQNDFKLISDAVILNCKATQLADIQTMIIKTGDIYATTRN